MKRSARSRANAALLAANVAASSAAAADHLASLAPRAERWRITRSIVDHKLLNTLWADLRATIPAMIANGL